MIQTDLDWVAANWQQNGCDLWEEIRSTDFFWNRYNYRTALLMGAEFAKAQGDAARAGTYGAAAKAVEATLMGHYQDGYVYETQDSGRKKDAAVMCAFNDGFLASAPLFNPSGPEVAGTIKELNSVFCPYAINGIDAGNGVPGILYGRYEGDNYDGGNPWILLTAALAEQLYRGAGELKAGAAALDTADAAAAAGRPRSQSQSQSQAVAVTTVTDETVALWESVLGQPVEVGAGAGEAARMRALAAALAGAGDGVLLRIREHIEPDDFHCQEQIDKNTGKQTSAKDLTWSYATVLKAMHARGQQAEL